MKAKKFTISVIIVTVVLLIVFACCTVIIDPYFHYHKPLDKLSYTFSEERYVNDGILRHFEYDGIITGTSMAENFKASEADKLWNGSFVKTPFSGESYRGIGERLLTAFKYNKDIKTVIWGLDASRVLDDKDVLRWEEYPDYLYDNNVFNDVRYVLNKDIFIKEDLNTLTYSFAGYDTTDFDFYANTNKISKYGKEYVLSKYSRAEKTDKQLSFGEEHKKTIRDNLDQNVTSLVVANPTVDFYLFTPPYNICYFDNVNRKGELKLFIEAMKYQTQLLLEYDNVHLYEFFDETSLICNLDIYKDTIHYNETINSWMLECMAEGRHRITTDNYEQYYNEIEVFYLNYDYDTIFA